MAKKSVRVKSGLGGRPNREVRHESGMIPQKEEIHEDIVQDEEEIDIVAKNIVSTLESSAGNISSWLNEVGKDDPAKALGIYLQLLEYHTPKMQRKEADSGKESGVSIELETIDAYKKRKESKKNIYGADFPE